MIYRVRHITHYEYEKPVTLSYNRAYLLPRNTTYQHCMSSTINISPGDTAGQERYDYFGNRVYFFSLELPHNELIIDISSDIQIKEKKYGLEGKLNFDQGVTCSQALQALHQGGDAALLDAREFVLDSPMIISSAGLREYAAVSFHFKRTLLSAVRELNQRIYADFTYDPESTIIATPLAEVLLNKRGVCQDFAQLAIGCLRSLGFPARYISGYLETFPPPGQEKMLGSGASHAWFSVYIPGEGWFEFDPTNNNIPAEHHITTAWGRDYGDVSPLRGVFFDGGKNQKLNVSVDVSRIETD
ncbi:transglutaminase [Psychromonas sp. MB-3u-54]|uniref:transglutaminase family protein n=1 Tax=Psychromonas sp. MB-3u-54 TaxID=2058319 RepID=UPI000C33AC3C|nr:transglutaminase family protein [Psychromonas sp. MB-3u-54]PKH03709.1 transglutaminase [Psychromonas sp. MB-3u-54]